MSISFYFKKDEKIVSWFCTSCGEEYAEQHPVCCKECGRADLWGHFTEAKHHINFSNSNAFAVLKLLGYDDPDYAGEIGSAELFKTTSGVLLLDKIQDQNRRRVEAVHALAMAAVEAEDPLVHWG